MPRRRRAAWTGFAKRSFLAAWASACPSRADLAVYCARDDAVLLWEL